MAKGHRPILPVREAAAGEEMNMTESEAATIRIVTFGPPFRRPDGEIYATYTGHEWREKRPKPDLRYRCIECGCVHDGALRDYHGAVCRPRYAPIDWFSSDQRHKILDELEHMNTSTMRRVWDCHD